MNWASNSTVVGEYVFTRYAVMHSRAKATPTLFNLFNSSVTRLDIFSFSDPMMVDIKNNRDMLRKIKAIVKSMAYFFVLNSDDITCFRTETG
jgi:hypothetical protein